MSEWKDRADVLADLACHWVAIPVVCALLGIALFLAISGFRIGVDRW